MKYNFIIQHKEGGGSGITLKMPRPVTYKFDISISGLRAEKNWQNFFEIAQSGELKNSANTRSGAVSKALIFPRVETWTRALI